MKHVLEKSISFSFMILINGVVMSRESITSEVTRLSYSVWRFSFKQWGKEWKNERVSLQGDVMDLYIVCCRQVLAVHCNSTCLTFCKPQKLVAVNCNTLFIHFLWANTDRLSKYWNCWSAIIQSIMSNIPEWRIFSAHSLGICTRSWANKSTSKQCNVQIRPVCIAALLRNELFTTNAIQPNNKNKVLRGSPSRIKP